MQVFSAVLVILLSAPNVNISLPSNGILGPEHDSCQHIWIICYAGCHGSWRVYHFKRSTGNSFNVYVLSVISYVYSFSCYIVTDDVPSWWIWGFWFSPLMYAQNAASSNEFHGHSWDKVI